MTRSEFLDQSHAIATRITESSQDAEGAGVLVTGCAMVIMASIEDFQRGRDHIPSDMSAVMTALVTMVKRFVSACDDDSTDTVN